VSKLSQDSTICWSQGHLAAEINNELVLMSVEKGNYYGLDAIGADIWRRLETQVSVSDLCASMCREYDADASTIRRDVLALLERLAAEGLIEIKS
jgi:hypothetical protein